MPRLCWLLECRRLVRQAKIPKANRISVRSAGWSAAAGGLATGICCSAIVE